MTKRPLDAEQLVLMGLANALQALVMVAIDSDEKRAKFEKIVNSFGERMLASTDYSPEEAQHYLRGLSMISAAGHQDLDE